MTSHSNAQTGIEEETDDETGLIVDRHTHASTYREKILEHHFISELLRHFWGQVSDADLPEVSHSEVDDNGYDVVIEWKSVVRHVQLKSTLSHDRPVKVNASLCRKPAGCVILMTCERDLSGVRFHWLGAETINRLDLSIHKPAKHTRANRLGIKGNSISSVVVPRRAFITLGGIHELVERMFPT